MRFLEGLVAPGPEFEFLERHYIAYRAYPETQVPVKRGGTTQLFEADLTPHFFFYNSLSRMTAHRLTALADPSELSDWSAAVSFSMRVRLRMLGEESAPVRTPSFMPRLNAQLYHLSDRPIKPRDEFALFGYRLSLGHHSNGQEGCPFQPGQLEVDGCAATPGLADPRDVNRTSGSFSINHLTAAVHYRWGNVDRVKVTADHAQLQDSETASVGLVTMVYPINFLAFGGNPRQQSRLYGTWNLRAEASTELDVPPLPFPEGSSPGRARFELAYTQFFGGNGEQRQFWEPRAARAVAAYLLTASATYSSIKSGGIGLFLRVDRGRDYYNMLFVDTITQLLLGFSIDTSGRLNFGDVE